jgi:hypothetical protein
MKTKLKLGLIFITNSRVKILKLITKPKTKIGTIFLIFFFEKTLKSRVNKRLVIISSLGSLELGLAFKTRTQIKPIIFLEKSSQI